MRAALATGTAVLAALGRALPALADHGAGLRQPGSVNPLLEALLWAGGAFVVGIAIVAAVSALTRRRSARKDADVEDVGAEDAETRERDRVAD